MYRYINIHIHIYAPHGGHLCHPPPTSFHHSNPLPLFVVYVSLLFLIFCFITLYTFKSVWLSAGNVHIASE